MTLVATALVCTPASAGDKKQDAISNAVHNNSFRAEGESDRDQYRHPEALLRFAGVTPTSTIIEVNPGGGWFSHIMAPLVKDKGQYVALEGNPKRYGSSGYAERLAVYDEKIKSNPAMYGKNAIASWLETSPSDVAAGSVDVAFAVRTLHNFARRGYFDTGVADIHAALKAGGHFVIVQHRASEDFAGDSAAANELGRFKQSDLVAKIEAAGFKLVASDEMNANAKDSENVSVWSLPPSLRGADKNDGKYKDTGESDRMTLKFVKVGS